MNGQGASGPGLTASVMKNPNTNEIYLEAGALVLSDMGLCCIDEFDKIFDNDKVALHEVMEQQTVSISKAGISTRLNARCSVLAAANPAYGRYNFEKTVHENVNINYSLLSRFDLVFVLIDKHNMENDTSLS